MNATAVSDTHRSTARQNTPPVSARVPAGTMMVVGVRADRLDIDDAGEPRVVEGTAAVVGRSPQLPIEGA